MVNDAYTALWDRCKRLEDMLNALEGQNRATHEMLSRQIEALRAYCDRLGRQLAAVDSDFQGRIRNLENAR